MNNLIEAQWPGFSVTCDNCNGTKIVLEDTRGYSFESGAWGDVSIICQTCKNRTVLVDTY
jgi:hypothetical protein